MGSGCRLQYPEFPNKVLKLWNEGIRDRGELAKKLSVGKTTISRAFGHLRDMGIAVEGKPIFEPLPPLQCLEEFNRENILYHQFHGYTIVEIHQAYGVSRDAVERLLYPLKERVNANTCSRPLVKNADDIVIAQRAKDGDDKRRYELYIADLRREHPLREVRPDSFRHVAYQDPPKQLRPIDESGLCSSAIAWD